MISLYRRTQSTNTHVVYVQTKVSIQKQNLCTRSAHANVISRSYASLIVYVHIIGECLHVRQEPFKPAPVYPVAIVVRLPVGSHHL